MLVKSARRDAIGLQGKRNLVAAWIWQRNIGVALCLEIALLVDGWLLLNKPPGVDFLAFLMSTTGLVAAWLVWRSCNRTLAKMGYRA